MNLTKAEKARLGVFITAGVTMFVGSVVTLAGLKLWERRDTYFVSFEESVSGLEPSAQVKYQGLRIGRVERIRVDPANPRNIQVELSLSPDVVLYEGTHAGLDMSGLTGIKTINLTAGDPDATVLSPGATLPTMPSLVDQISDRAASISEKMNLVANNLARWTSPENQVRFERLVDSTTQLLDDVDRMVVDTRQPLVAALEQFSSSAEAVQGLSNEGARTLASARGELKETLVAARTTLEETRRILKAMDSEQISTTLASASSAMASLDRQLSAEEMNQAFGELRIALTNLTALMQEMDLTVRASREDLVMSLKHVRQATQDLREFSRIVAQDPSVLLRGKETSE